MNALVERLVSECSGRNGEWRNDRGAKETDGGDARE